MKCSGIDYKIFRVGEMCGNSYICSIERWNWGPGVCIKVDAGSH